MTSQNVRPESFDNYCTCGGFAWQMNGRPKEQPHEAWCAQYDEWRHWVEQGWQPWEGESL